MDKYLSYLLRSLQKEGSLVSVFNNPTDPEGFVVGRVLDMDESHFLLSELNPWGEQDAIRLRRTDEIIEILHGEEYEMRLELLMAYRGVKLSEFFTAEDNRCGVLIRDVMEKCQRTGEIVTFWVGNDLYTGRIIDVNELHVTMRMFDFFAAQTADEVFSLRELAVVQVRSPEEAMYALLEENQPSVPHLV